MLRILLWQFQTISEHFGGKRLEDAKRPNWPF